jgi:hypothetical protein
MHASPLWRWAFQQVVIRYGVLRRVIVTFQAERRGALGIAAFVTIQHEAFERVHADCQTQGSLPGTGARLADKERRSANQLQLYGCRRSKTTRGTCMD